jgi:hypothetical protein
MLSVAPYVFVKGPVALVDMGFKSSSISLLLAGTFFIAS